MAEDMNHDFLSIDAAKHSQRESNQADSLPLPI